MPVILRRQGGCASWFAWTRRKRLARNCFIFKCRMYELFGRREQEARASSHAYMSDHTGNRSSIILHHPPVVLPAGGAARGVGLLSIVLALCGLLLPGATRAEWTPSDGCSSGCDGNGYCVSSSTSTWFGDSCPNGWAAQGDPHRQFGQTCSMTDCAWICSNECKLKHRRRVQN